MMRVRMFSFVLVLALAFGLVPSRVAYAAESKDGLQGGITVMLSGNKYELKKAALLKNGGYLISLEDAAKLYSASYTLDKTGRKAEVKKDTDIVKYTVGVRSMNVNGKNEELSRPTLSYNGSMYVSAVDTGRVLGFNVTEDVEAGTITVARDKSSLILAQDTIIPLESNPELQELTIKAAIEMATKNNNNLKALDANVKAYQRELDDSQQKFSTVALMNPNATADDLITAQKTLVNSLIAMEQTKNAIDLTNANMEVTKESIEYSMLSLFASIKDAERAIAQQEYNMTIIEASLVIARKRAELGMLSSKDLKAQELSYQSAVKTLNDNKLKLEKSYINLNSMLGVKAGTRYNISLDLEYNPVGEVNIDSLIRQEIANSTQIMQLQQALDMAEYQSKIYLPNSSSVEDKKDAVNKAERDLSEAKKNIDKNLRTSYNDLLTMEASIEEAERSLLKARDDYKLLEEQYRLGMITELTLKEAEYRIAATEFSMISTKISHELSVISFKNANI